MNRLFVATLPLVALFGVPANAQSSADPGTLPDLIDLGRNAQGDPCTAAPNWKDPATTNPFSKSFSFTCRGSIGSRFVGIARQVRLSEIGAVDETLLCGSASEVAVPKLGEVVARRCFDKFLGQETIEIRMARGRLVYSVSAFPFAQGPAEQLLRILVSGRVVPLQPSAERTGAVALDSLAPAPTGSANLGSANAAAEAKLEQGLQLVRQGLHLDASGVAREALSRLPGDASPSTRIELLLLAGLADSNLRFFNSAESYFRQADELLESNAEIPDATLLVRKRRNYAALDLLNRRDFALAVGALDKLALTATETGQPLLDASTVRLINQSRRSDANGSDIVAIPDEAGLSQLVIEAQASWARSVALLGQNNPKDAGTALLLADRAFEQLRAQPIRQQQLLWLAARIERQRARLQLRSGDRTAALVSLDKAVNLLKEAETNGDFGPALAQTQLERAGVLSRGSADRQMVFAQFDEALTSLLNAQAATNVLPPSLGQYLDLLSSDAAQNPDGSSPDRFFRALQIAADPAVARQFIELQSLVTADPALASKVRDRQELGREIARLRFEVSGLGPNDAEKLGADNAKLVKLEDQSIAFDGQLRSNRSYVQVDNQPVSIAEVRKTLLPGEAFLKLSRINAYVFGTFIDDRGSAIFRSKLIGADVDTLVDAVRASIDGGDNTKVPIFKVAVARALFRGLTGAIGERLLGAKSLVVDASGVLDKLPIGVLVTDDASPASFAKTVRNAPYDYRAVNFLARRMPIATSLSPRSFIVSRSLASSRAPYPFIGFAQHLPAQVTAQMGGRMVSVGSGCEAELSKIAELTQQLQPINARELGEAENALGVTNAPELTGAAFTDQAIRERTDLDQFQVLHFATHGVTEGQWACSKAPPALVTSLGESGSDAILSFDEVARLRLDANLVVLSACDTSAGVSVAGSRASGQEEVGGSLDGLVRAFLAANARAVLSTYWPISDAGESEALIRDFYAAARTDTIETALQTAQLRLMTSEQSSHPLYWGAFFLVGDGQKPLLTGAAKAATNDKPPGPISGAGSSAR